MSKHTPTSDKPYKPRLGIALGSGSARGMAHIGILQALAELDIRPDIICGSSAGSMVGAASAMGKLTELEEWVTHLSTSDILRYMNISLAASGGFANANNLIDHLRNAFGNPLIEDLQLPYAAVATDLASGREIWLQQGPIWDAVRASMALPGLFTPVMLQHHWLVDGGLVNPVPVSVCRAMGADIIIAVNLNDNLVRQRNHTGQKIRQPKQPEPEPEPNEDAQDSSDPDLLERWSSNIKEKAQPILEHLRSREKESVPAVMDVIASSINIMQDRITRSRLAGEPADIVLTPSLGHIGLMELSRADECIAEGKACIERSKSDILKVMGY